MIETFSSYFIGESYKSAIAFGLMVVMLILRPSGIMGEILCRGETLNKRHLLLFGVFIVVLFVLPFVVSGYWLRVLTQTFFGAIARAATSSSGIRDTPPSAISPSSVSAPT
ncbi:MAG: hypothetical protein MZV70_13815 [Desulfobacterales bacterium]|nr:hypothetical protein [Desulfobacterales bacterium]